MRPWVFASWAGLLILAPLSASAEEQLPIPVQAIAQDIVLPPSRAIIAATVAKLSEPPPKVQQVRLTCVVWMPRGAPTDCLPFAAKLPREWAKFREKSLAFQNSKLDGPVQAALDRVMFTRLKPDIRPEAPSRKLYVFDVEVAPGDTLGSFPQAEIVPTQVLEIIQRPDPGVMAALYPERALRRGLAAHVVVTCRVGPDLTLLCRDAKVAQEDWPDWADQRVAYEFELATYQLSSMLKVRDTLADGRKAAGFDVQLSFGWDPNI